jgi:hypothetical protein
MSPRGGSRDKDPRRRKLVERLQADPPPAGAEKRWAAVAGRARRTLLRKRGQR